jgi:chromosome segregation ATPase
MNSLLAEYQRLVQRREALTTERTELTTRLDRGELTAAQFHKELRARIQEAAQVSENLRATAARLSELGYTGLGR